MKNISYILKVIFINKIVYFVLLSYSLRWYLLGKHSNFVFTTNRNTEESNEDLLIECLSADTLKKSKILLPDDNKSINDTELATVESDLGVSYDIIILDSNINLLEIMEIQVLLNIYYFHVIEYNDYGLKNV